MKESNRIKGPESVRAGIYMMLAGILIAALAINIGTDISYGFIMGNNE